MGRSLKATWIIQKKDGKPLVNLYIFVLRGHKMLRLHILYTKFGPLAPKLVLLTSKLTLGEPFPTGPQHKSGDFPLSHSTCTKILSQRPPSSTCTIATLAVHCVSACLICSTSYSVAVPAPSTCTFYFVSCKLANFPSMVAMRTYASSSQGFNQEFNKASLCCAASTCSFNTFASCNFSSL